MNDAGVHPSQLGKVCMSIRTFPIRVGNIKDELGHEIGNSGPCYEDQNELKFSDIGVPDEVTTVTKRVRRVFSFSCFQYSKALIAIRPDIVFVNFLNYMPHEEQRTRLTYDMQRCELETGIVPAKLWGCGPATNEVFTRYPDAVDYINRNQGGNNEG